MCYGIAAVCMYLLWIRVHLYTTNVTAQAWGKLESFKRLQVLCTIEHSKVHKLV
jgi:hypothetical protein